MKQQRAYQYRCYPTPSQRQMLAQTFGCVRFVYNWGLRLRTDAYRERGEHVFYRDTSAALTTLKQQPELAWLNEVSSVPPQQALRHLEKAFRNFFAGRTAYPKFKKKRDRQSAEYTTSAFKWDGSSLLLAKMTEPLPIRWSRPFPKDARPTTITVSRDAAGRYSVSFLVTEDIRPLPVSSKTVGIDLGLQDVVTLSTGEKTGTEHFFTKEEKRLATLQRRHAKKQKHSKNREKARLKAAKLHARIADRRRDFLHKLTTRLIRENQVICVESLQVKNMLQNHALAKAIADVGWGELIRQLEYKATWYGRTLVAIDRFFPSSKRCHGCGYLLDNLDLDVRQWACPNCDLVHDRDINAALNVKAAGLAVLACGGAVRPNLNGTREGTLR
ncbi:MAG TPA: RNA-guided endonuclease TnpB family protein [Ktedonobacterales bacterium]|nr:RNA-guided endonuclease TnpB family protein [Ktedonobacterales bacterium]